MSFSLASVTRWTGEVTADHQGYRVLGAGAHGTMQPTSRLAVNFPAIVRRSDEELFWKDSGSRAGDVI